MALAIEDGIPAENPAGLSPVEPTGSRDPAGSRNPGLKPYRIPIWFHHQLKKALRKAGSDKEVFIIGGEQVYKEGLRYADKIYVTEVDGEFKGDAYFPILNKTWKEVKREEKEGKRAKAEQSYRRRAERKERGKKEGEKK